MKKYVSTRRLALRNHIASPSADKIPSNDSPDVEFCGYSIPHPSEAVLHLRIQTWGMCPTHVTALMEATRLTRIFPDDVPVNDVLRKGLDDLCDLCDVVVDKFTASRDAFNQAHPDGVDPRS